MQSNIKTMQRYNLSIVLLFYLCSGTLFTIHGQNSMLAWEDVWYSASEVEVVDIISYSSNEWKTTKVASKKMKDMYMVWLFYKGILDIKDVGRAYLLSPNNEIIYDYEMDRKASFNVINQNSKKIATLEKHCEIWLINVLNLGYEKSKNKKVLSPLPSGYRWVRF